MSIKPLIGHHNTIGQQVLRSGLKSSWFYENSSPANSSLGKFEAWEIVHGKFVPILENSSLGKYFH
jgi:hypothetical protein